MFKRLLLGLAVAITLLATALPVAAQTVPGSVEPARGVPGATLTFTASGYEPDEKLAAWVNLPDGSVQTVPTPVHATEQGVMIWQWKVPANAVSGLWRMVGRGQDSLVQSVIPVQIDGLTATPALTTTSGVTPASGSPGTVFTFSVGGFAPEERLSYWATQADGTVIVNNATVATNGEGRAEWQWVAPDTRAYGRWTMTVFSRNTSVRQQIAFTLTAAGAPAAQPADNSVTPQAGVPGTTFRFVASGFLPNIELRRWTTAPDGSSAAAGERFNADPNGRVEFEYSAPADAIAGSWVMVVATYGEGARGVTRSIPFRIERSDAAAAEGVSPAEGRAGDTLTFFATGLPSGMLLDYFATDPNGVGEPLPKQVQADATGRAEWRWQIPAGAATGRWAMSLRRAQQDRSGGAYVQRQIFFAVR